MNPSTTIIPEITKETVWFFATVTFEPDKTKHAHAENCFVDEEYNIQETTFNFDGKPPEKKIIEHTRQKNLCGFDGLKFMRFVVFAMSPESARERADEYIGSRIPEGYKLYGGRDYLNLYRKNYIRESKKLASLGKYIQ